jgi:hypothetical protein
VGTVVVGILMMAIIGVIYTIFGKAGLFVLAILLWLWKKSD